MSTTLRSTPNSHEASAVSAEVGLLGVNVEKIRPWIEGDIQQAQPCHIDNMLRVFLQRASHTPKAEQHDLLEKCLKQVVLLLNETPAEGTYHPSRIREFLDRYTSNQIETASYEHFVQAFNIAFTCLVGLEVEGMLDTPSDLDIICQVNDYPIQQDHQERTSTRKPDVIILPYKCARDALPEDKRNVSPSTYKVNNAAAKPKGRLLWKDTLACIEFKRPNKELSPCPLSYEVGQYKPTNPEYWPIEHLVPGAVSAQAITATSAPPSDSSRRANTLADSQNVSNNSGKRKADDILQPPTKRTKTQEEEEEEEEEDEEEEPERKLDVTVQTGLYAAEMFAANVAVKHVINLVIVGNVARVWYYDRQGTIQSSGINFIQDLPQFLVLLYALQRFSLADWGRHADFNEDDKSVSHKIMIGDVDLELHTSHQDRATHYALKGRATNVFPVTSKKLAKDHLDVAKAGMIAKVFWGEQQRTSEPDILNKVSEIAEELDSVKGHVPVLLWHYKFTEPTSEIREALGVSKPRKGSRVLYILVFPKLQPITDLQDTDFFNVWKQCILCHYDLWHAGVYHRDVSPANMMWYRKGSVLMGVLNDYDLSSFATPQGPQGNERIGTMPFMALDLLTQEGQRGKVEHLYRHDLESFMWVLVWVPFRYKNGRLLPRKNRPFDNWATVDAEACHAKKSSFLTNTLGHEPFARKQRIWRLIARCFEVLRAESGRRQCVRIEQQELLAEGGGQIVAENIELDDHKFMGLFMATKAWVQFSNSLK